MRTRRSYKVDEDVQRAVDAAVIALKDKPGVYTPGRAITQAALVSHALAREVRRLERRYNDGQRFPRSRKRLRPGRPATPTAD